MAVAYDDVGNLEEDEAGREYVYDEANRLVQVKAADETVLANYVYDALGRRISFEDPVAGVTTRYYYDGSRVIEERDADNQRLRYHVHGAQFVDERVATFEDESRAFDRAGTFEDERRAFDGAGVDDGRDVSAEDGARPAGDDAADAECSGRPPWRPTDAATDDHAANAGVNDTGVEGSTGADARGSVESRYYLLGPNYSVVGYGNADGSVIERLDFTSSGDWVSGGDTAPGYYHDADADFDIDLADVASFAGCFDPAGGQASPGCLAAHDYDDAGVSDGVIDLDDFTALTGCYAGPYVTPDQDCARPTRGDSLPDSGTYALHGRPVDVLSDGLVLVNFRARTYLPQHARFLQRDPTGYSDGSNLYEAFGSNPLTFLDPLGLWIANRIGEILSEKGEITVGDIQHLGEELNSDPAHRVSPLTDDELLLLRLLSGAEHGTPWTEETLSENLRSRAEEDFSLLAPPYRYRAQANLSTRRRLLYILLLKNEAFSQYATDLYRLSRDVNPIHFAAERGWQIGSGHETITGEEVSRFRAAAEFARVPGAHKGGAGRPQGDHEGPRRRSAGQCRCCRRPGSRKGRKSR